AVGGLRDGFHAGSCLEGRGESTREPAAEPRCDNDGVDASLLAAARAAGGFMPDDEGLALYRAGLWGAARGPPLELASYSGTSAPYVGAAAREGGTILYSVDHHRGSEENQAGWPHHDGRLVDPRTGRMDSLPFFRRTVEDAGLEDVVVAVVGNSPTVAAHWA